MMENGNGDRFELGFGSWKLGLNGPHTLLVILIILVFFGFTYLNLSAIEAVQDGTDRAHGHIIFQLERILEEARLIAYLTSIAEKDRPRVILPKPLMERIKPEYRPDVKPDTDSSIWKGMY